MHQPFIHEVPNSQTALLCIHGILGTPRHFDFLLPLVPKNWSIYNILLDGHGGAVTDFSHTSMSRWESQISELVSRLSAHGCRIVICAHSMGTLFAIDAALTHSDQVAALFLMNPPLKLAPKPRVFLTALKVAFDRVRPTDMQAVITQKAYSMPPDPHLWHYFGWIPRYLELLSKIRATNAQLPALRVPTLAFASRFDELLSRKALEKLQLLKNVQTFLLPHSGHYGYTQEDTALLLQNFETLCKSIKTAD